MFLFPRELNKQFNIYSIVLDTEHCLSPAIKSLIRMEIWIKICNIYFIECIVTCVYISDSVSMYTILQMEYRPTSSVSDIFRSTRPGEIYPPRQHSLRASKEAVLCSRVRPHLLHVEQPLTLIWLKRNENGENGLGTHNFFIAGLRN